MQSYKRIFAIFFVFTLVCGAWMVLGGITTARKYESSSKLRGDVEKLWGSPQIQNAPEVSFLWETSELATRTETVHGTTTEVREWVTKENSKAVTLERSEIETELKSDLRRRGLVWYSLYDVKFDAEYGYHHRDSRAGRLAITFRFPDPRAVYDAFVFTINGEDFAPELEPGQGYARASIPVEPGQGVNIHARYRSRGMDSWEYRPASGVSRLKNFRLAMTTDFREIDFPTHGMSPSTRKRTGKGYRLEWKFKQVVSGHTIGMITPQRIQPGELAAALSFSAPVSLFFFFLVLFVFATLRKIDIHPVNYLFLGGAFFAFHILFAYAVDHLPVVPTFIIASCVSVVLVVSYLRLVVSPRFAFVEAAIAQLVYLVGFSMAHFWEGFTGLTITVLAILTLFLLMQLTGRIRWSEVFGAKTAPSRA